MMISPDLAWWITAFDLPCLGSLFLLIRRAQREQAEAAARLKDLTDARNAQLREALAAFKLEVAKSYASITDLRDLEARLVAHLLRIEAKLDTTALKTESLRASKDQP